MSQTTLYACSLVILLGPLAGAVLIGALGRPVLRERSHWPAILGVAAAAAAAFVLLAEVRGAARGAEQVSLRLYDWIASGATAAAGAASSWFAVEVLIDPLTVLMLVTVTFVSLLVVIYSRDYMRTHGHAERGYERFFAFLALFVFSMCVLVLAGNFLLLYLGWELVGLCSYLLIGFYYDRPSAAAAAKKAFLVNRIGDFGFGLGILLIYLTFGRLDYSGVFALIGQGLTSTGEAIPDGRLATIALLLFCGAAGKSAQLPLYVWLPDAMEGPSPVSALIHAATMVTAGVYMVARCGAIFVASEAVMTVVAVVGGLTALYAACIALTQHDMKRILAYSTISQLGYMFLGLGVYAADSAMFHLFTHAFFKALLFLAAGSVMHAMGGIIDLRRFSGLRRVLPWTCRLCVVGSLALAGFPLLSGFWSKDEIIHHAFEANWGLGLMGLLTAGLTAFYTFRMVFRCFWGEQRVPEGVHAHESGRWMLAPMTVLAIGALAAGYFQVPGERISGFLGPATVAFAGHGHEAGHVAAALATEHVAAAGEAVAEVGSRPVAVLEHAAIATSGEHADAKDWGVGTTETEAGAAAAGFWARHWLMFVSGGLAVLAILAAYLAYVAMPWVPPLAADFVPGVYRASFHKFYVDEAYDAGVVRPLRRGGLLCFGIDEYVVDGILWGITLIPRGLAFVLRSLQGGALQGYALTMAAGLAIIVWLVMFS